MEVGFEGCLDMLMLCACCPLTMYPKIHTHTHTHTLFKSIKLKKNGLPQSPMALVDIQMKEQKEPLFLMKL